MYLERETTRRMAELFARRVCCRCGRPAERLGHGRFYCDHHFPWGRSKEAVPRVYKCRVS
jgi:hypothetical protein